MTEAQVHSSLVSVSARYVDMAKRDIMAALSHFRDLHPGTEWYVFNDGSRRQLVTLNGTIPVAYKGNTYNIPICLYLLDTHPYYPPIGYVRPTADMVIRPSAHVDNSGKIYLPYLHEWRHPQSDLIGLIQVMAIVFGEHCPVFSRGAASAGATPGGQAYPYNTPYPTSNPYGMPMPMPAPSPAGHAGGGAAPGYPPYPSGPAGNRSSYPSYTPPSTTASPGTTAYNYPSNPSYTSAGTGTGTIQPEHIRLSLLSAIEDKMRSQLRDSIGTAHAELQSIKKTREDLTKGEQKLKSMLSTLENEQGNLDAALIAYREFIDSADKALAQAADADEFSIDDAIDTTTPLFRQLLSCYVEDSAIEDTIYYLGQGLKRGCLDLDTYLKHVRTLSRNQFMLRATMQRCRRVAGLDA